MGVVAACEFTHTSEHARADVFAASKKRDCAERRPSSHVICWNRCIFDTDKGHLDMKKTNTRTKIQPKISRDQRRLAPVFSVVLGTALIIFAWWVAKSGGSSLAETDSVMSSTENPSSNSDAWPLDAIPEKELARRLEQEAALRMARMPEDHVAAAPGQTKTLTPHQAMAQQWPMASPRIAASTAASSLSENPNGVNGVRPARPTPGFKE